MQPDPGRHQPHHAGDNMFIYIPDPAGNIMELSTEMVQIWDELSYQPRNWTKGHPGTVDVWRAMPQPKHMSVGEGRDFNDWTAGSAGDQPARFSVNMAIFILLDDLPDGRGGKIEGLDSNYEQTVFGQGVTARWRNLEVVDVGEKWHIN